MSCIASITPAVRMRNNTQASLSNAHTLRNPLTLQSTQHLRLYNKHDATL